MGSASHDTAHRHIPYIINNGLPALLLVEGLVGHTGEVLLG